MTTEVNRPFLGAPPRLLLGVSFLFWGAMHDQPLAALLAAILVEGRHWTALRWDFGIRGFARSWQLSMVILIVSSIGLLRSNGLSTADFLDLLAWLPFMMLPLALAQQYAVAKGVPTVTFSFIARRKIGADRRLGRPVVINLIHAGYPFFVLILIAAGMGVGKLTDPGRVDVIYVAGILILSGWAFYLVGGRCRRPAAWLGAFVLAMGLASVMLWGLSYAYDLFVRGGGFGDRDPTSALETRTDLSDIATLQLSPTIRWRYYHEKGELPRLLKLGSYNIPHLNYWLAGTRRKGWAEKIEVERQAGGDFERLLSDRNGEFRYDKVHRPSGDFPVAGRLVGIIPKETVVPHGAGTRMFEGVPADIMSVNSLGAFQLSEAKKGAMEVTFRADREVRAIAIDPSLDDLIYIMNEEAGLTSFLEKVGLEVPASGLIPERRTLSQGISTNRRPSAESSSKSRKPKRGSPLPRSQTRIAVEPSPPAVSRERFWEIEGRISRAFSNDFTYSLYLEGDDSTPISKFLGETRKGHCEFFAGATAMLFRRMGVPCRYVVGYSVQENSGGNEWILRGRHAHAWVEAYMGGQWVNEGTGESPIWRCRGGKWVTIDLTPADWSSAAYQYSWTQWFSDTFERLRSWLMLWSTSPILISGILIFIGVAGGIVVLMLVYQLVKTRDGVGKAGQEKRLISEPALLRDFEKWLARRVGSRPVSLSMGAWVRAHLGDGGMILADHYEHLTFRECQPDIALLRDEVKRAKRFWREQQKKPGADEPAGLL